MGHDAAIIKKRVLGKVEDCIDATNITIKVVEELRDKHDGLCARLTDKDAETAARFSAQGAWIEQTEHEIGQQRQRLNAIIAQAQVFDELSVWRRLWWLLTGRWPKPLPATGWPSASHPVKSLSLEAIRRPIDPVESR
jgi:hypothetical protein